MTKPEYVKTRPLLVCTLGLILGLYVHVQGMDSTNVGESGGIPILPDNSLLGTAENNKLCSYKTLDKKIHCQSNQKGASEYKVTAIRSPVFPRFQPRRTGTISVVNNTRYGFIAPLSYNKVGHDTIVCKLALNFKPTGKAAVWIWFDEIRFDGSNHRAFVDTNGDGLIDSTLVGKWNGNLYGSNRWWTPDPFDGRYSSTLREFTNRPEFGTVGGKVRGCSVENVKVATLVAIN